MLTASTTVSVSRRRLEAASRRTLGPIALLVALGCPAASDAPAPVSDSATASTPTPTPTRQSPLATPWYSAARTLDLTGDGTADSIRLEAVGTRPDSLSITLRFIVDGTEKHREEWGSSYELALVDSAVRTGPGVDALLRAKLDTVLASVTVQPLDTPGARPMAEDSAALAGLDPRPGQRISFSYGYETMVRLVWDAPRDRFVRLWSCC